MNFLAFVVFFVLPTQQINKPETVALVFGPDPVRIEIVKTEEAEAKYEQLKLDLLLTPIPKEEDVKMFAALTVALDRVPHVQDQRRRLDWEIRRGVRAPLQKPDRGNQ